MQIGAHHPNLVIFFIEVMEQDIAQGDYTLYFPSRTYWQVSEAVAFHQSHAGFKVIAGRDRQRIFGHDLTDWSVGSILPRNHDAAHQIALRENAHQMSVLQHWNGSDVVLHHEPGNFKSRLPHLGEDSDLISEQIRDQHLHLLGTRRRPFGSSGTFDQPTKEAKNDIYQARGGVYVGNGRVESKKCIAETANGRVISNRLMSWLSGQ